MLALSLQLHDDKLMTAGDICGVEGCVAGCERWYWQLPTVVNTSCNITIT